MQKEASSSINKVLAAILIGVMLILMIGIVASGWQTDNNGENSGDLDNVSQDADNLNGDTDKNSGTADNFTNNENTAPKYPEHISYLTGLEIEEELENRIPMAMVIDPNAPTYGISDSELTIEIPTENGKTRFITYIRNINELGKIGAFVSTRNYMSELTAFFGGFLISMGKDDIISYPSLSSSSIFDLSSHSDVIYKENGRNVYTDSESIFKIAKNDGIDLFSYKKEILPFEFSGFEEQITGKTSAKEVFIKYSEENSTALAYDESTKEYNLYKNERIKVDMLNGKSLSYKNVFILFADVTTYETASGTESIVNTATEGTGYYISNGTLTEIRWSVDASNKLICRSLRGDKLIINRGNSYIGYYKSSACDMVTIK